MTKHKPSIREVILVEGKYDKITLSQVVDATIMTTDGFGIFRDKKRLSMLRRIAVTRGLILFTDSDGAGLVIRNYLKGAIPGKYLKQAYIPNINGKERRKEKASKAGTLGVEGMTREVLLNALKYAGATIDDQHPVPQHSTLTKQDLYALGLSGKENSGTLRKALLQHLDLPQNMSTNAMLAALNLLVDYDTLAVYCKTLQEAFISSSEQ